MSYTAFSRELHYMLKCCPHFSSKSAHLCAPKKSVAIVLSSQTPSQPGSGSVSCREQHQLSAEDGLGEDRLPALRLPHRPMALERVQWPHAPEPLQLRLVVSEVGDSHQGWIRVWKMGSCKEGRQERRKGAKKEKGAMEMAGERWIDGWVGGMNGSMSGWIGRWMDGWMEIHGSVL